MNHCSDTDNNHHRQTVIKLQKHLLYVGKRVTICKLLYLMVRSMYIIPPLLAVPR